MTRSRQTADWGSRAGLAKIVPSSVAVGSGTGSADSLGTVTFTGVSSLSLNDVFNTTYDSYRLIFNISSSSGSPAIRFRMRVSNADITGANYAYAHTKNAYTTSNSADGAGNQTSGVISYYGVAPTNGSFDIHSPFLAQETGIIGQNKTSADIWHLGLKHTLSTSYTGFTLYPDSGTMTGTLSIYGYTK